MTLRYYDPITRDHPVALGIAADVAPLDRFIPAPHRDGVPLPALTTRDLIGQLSYRTLGPKYGKAKAFVDWVLSGDTKQAVCGRYHVDPKSLKRWHQKVRSAGHRQPLTYRIWRELHTGIGCDTVNVRARDILGSSDIHIDQMSERLS